MRNAPLIRNLSLYVRVCLMEKFSGGSRESFPGSAEDKDRLRQETAAWTEDQGGCVRLKGNHVRDTHLGMLPPLDQLQLQHSGQKPR